jgi:hypothetical protein
MFNDLPTEYRPEEMERHAYNAAFYELGFQWHWDQDTYRQLSQIPNAAQRIQHYLETRQPHLLKAYDADFLVAAIQHKQAEHRNRAAELGAKPCAGFDWAPMFACQLGT